MEGEEPGVFGYKRHRLGWGNQDGLKISKGWLSPLVATGGILRPTSGKSPRGTGWKEGRAAPYRLEVGQSLTSSSVPWLCGIAEDDSIRFLPQCAVHSAPELLGNAGGENSG